MVSLLQADLPEDRGRGKGGSGSGRGRKRAPKKTPKKKTVKAKRGKAGASGAGKGKGNSSRKKTAAPKKKTVKKKRANDGKKQVKISGTSKKKTKKKTKKKKAGPKPRPKKPLKTSPGRPKELTDKEAGWKKRERSNIYKARVSASARDIAPLPVEEINWKRRNACKDDLQRFCETYLSPVFYLGWSEDQKRCIKTIQTVFIDGGMFALAMPRGGGKTALARASMLWGTSYGIRRFPFFIGSHHNKALQTLDFIKTYWFRSTLLQQDFPEIGYPFKRLENRFQLAKGQLYLGEPTHIEWGSESLRYPCLLLPEEDAEPYLKNAPDFLQYLEEFQSFIPRSAGTIITTAGIEGSIRGEAEVHPILLEQPRPDVVLLDDIQKDQRAESPAACEKTIRLIDGAVAGLAGPGETIAAIMPMTVIREGDVSDTYLDQTQKPEWRGERCSMVIRWPEGITDNDISLDSKAGRLWNQYGEERKQSLRLYKDIRLATKFYKKNRREMDKGFDVSWEQRFNGKTELSAQQHSMNLRFMNPLTFVAEYQNKPRRFGEDGLVSMLTADQLSEKTVDLERGHIPADCSILAGFIDIQDEILFWAVLAAERNFNGYVIDYGTFPEINSLYFHKHQTQSWGLLTREFFKAYPDQRNKAVKSSKGKIQAPFEAKIYHALTQGTNYLLSKDFIREDGHQTPERIPKIAIDTRWGKASETIKRFIRESGRKELLPYYGQPMPPTRKQFEEFTRTRGWLFEDQVHPEVKEVSWVFKPDQMGQYHLTADVNRVKTFLHSRLSSPLGAPGSFALFKAPPEVHSMFGNHVCESEYPETVQARGLVKDCWQEREGRPDNDWLDCLVGCCVVASLQGACIRSDGKAKPKTTRAPRRKLSQIYANKRKGGR